MTCDVSTQGRTAGKACRKYAACEWESGNENSPSCADTARNEDTLAARLSESYLRCSHSNGRRLGNLMERIELHTTELVCYRVHLYFQGLSQLAREKTSLRVASPRGKQFSRARAWFARFTIPKKIRVR